MKKILLVEDSKTVLGLLRYKFEEYRDIEVLYARDYKTACEIILNYKKEIQVALLDINLPDAPDGEIITFANQYNIPTVVLTASINKKLRKTIQKMDIISYIIKNKPSSLDLAVKTVMSALRNSDRYVLLVDDSKTTRFMLKSILENINLNVIEAYDGKEALEILEKSEVNISLVITDYNMPIMNGLDLTIKLRESYSKDEIAIIAVSGSSDKELIDDFLTFGANDFLTKPFSPSEVIARVNSNLELICLFHEMSEMANKDFLTSAYNRRYFFESGFNIYTKNKRKNTSIAVCMIDIDHFKKINDTYGHNTGDIAIKEIKLILDKYLRSSDLLARFGGEEFCILLEDISRKDLENKFETIRKAFEENEIDVNGAKIKYTVSFGIAYGMTDSLNRMVELSDEALYYAKKNGRNQVTIKDINI